MSRPKLRKSEPLVPSGPFADWLNRRYDELVAAVTEDDGSVRNVDISPAVQLATEIGFVDGSGDDAAVRRMYRYRKAITETKRDGKTAVFSAPEYARSVVENACHQVNPDLFLELYPEFSHERDIMLEPDAWCPFCEEWVTPIDGLCPWCVCEHGHLFREVGFTEDGYACLACAKEEQRERRRGYTARVNERRREKRREQKEAA